MTVDPARYLERIGFVGDVRHDATTLERLQRRHLTAVPFENLHVFHRRGVETATTWSVPKIVEQRRGGWCFEVNGAFADLLEALGFEVHRYAATVLLEGFTFPVPDHLTLEVTLDRPYLVDVGFGDSFIRPLPLDGPGPHDGGVGDFFFEFDGDRVVMSGRTSRRELEPIYSFARHPVEMAAFDEISTLLQTRPGLHWTEKVFATRLLDEGPDRVILLMDRIKFRRDGAWAEEPVAAEDWDAVLLEWFDLTP